VTLVVEAVSVGHDLNRGTSAFTRASRPAESDDADLREHNASLGSSGPQVSSVDGAEVPAAPATDETAA
jgi:hypothetical protein